MSQLNLEVFTLGRGRVRKLHVMDIFSTEFFFYLPISSVTSFKSWYTNQIWALGPLANRERDLELKKCPSD